MKIGFIGAGRIAKTFGRHLITGGHQIVLSNSRGPETLKDLVDELGPNASAGTKQDAANCDITILAVNWVDAPSAIEGIDWTGRILIDAMNAHMAPHPDISLEGVTKSFAELGGRNSTVEVAKMAKGARVVKAISNMPMDWIQDFTKDKPKTVIFAAGNDLEAKQIVVDLINGLGFVAVDLGSLEIGGSLFLVGGPLSGLDLHFVRRLR
jgi:predicted dinucleotide-binding enzyme